jgi:hypothetical protein
MRDCSWHSWTLHKLNRLVEFACLQSRSDERDQFRAGLVAIRLRES